MYAGMGRAWRWGMAPQEPSWPRLSEGSEEEVGHSGNLQQGASCLKEAGETRLPRRGQAWWTGPDLRATMASGQSPPGLRGSEAQRKHSRDHLSGSQLQVSRWQEPESSAGTFIHVPSA